MFNPFELHNPHAGPAPEPPGGTLTDWWAEEAARKNDLGRTAAAMGIHDEQPGELPPVGADDALAHFRVLPTGKAIDFVRDMTGRTDLHSREDAERALVEALGAG